MKHNRILWLILTLSLALVLVACGGPAAPESGDDGADDGGDTGEPADDGGDDGGETEEGLTFGMILVGPRNDRGWSQAHYEGGEYIEANVPGAEMIVFEKLNPADSPEATVEGVVDDMVSQGASLVFLTSDEFEEDTVGGSK